MKTLLLTLLLTLIEVVLGILLNTFIVQACWNAFVPAVSTLPHITFLQAFILFAGVRTLAQPTTIKSETKS